MTNGIPVCIECGGPVNALNEDESGSACPACAERLLETLPGVFHAPWGEEAKVEGGREDAEEPESWQEAPRPGGPGSSGSSHRGDSFGDPRGSA